MVTQASSKDVFVDLDALQVEFTKFKYRGREFRIRPLSTMNFFEFSNGVAMINDLLKKKTEVVSVQEVDEAYIRFFTSCVDDLTSEDVLKMNMFQRAALMNLIVDHVQGRVQGDANGKKLYPRSARSGKSTSQLRG